MRRDEENEGISYTDEDAPGTIPRGTTIVEVKAEKDDPNPVSTKGKVLGFSSATASTAAAQTAGHSASFDLNQSTYPSITRSNTWTHEQEHNQSISILVQHYRTARHLLHRDRVVG
jgi:hypothetical protein